MLTKRATFTSRKSARALSVDRRDDRRHAACRGSEKRVHLDRSPPPCLRRRHRCLRPAATHACKAQIDVLFLRKGYNPKVGDLLDNKQTIVYEAKTSFSGSVPGDQLRKLRPLSELEVRSIHSNMRYMADGLGGFQLGPNTRFKAWVRAWKGFGAYVLKHTPEILIGTTVVVRAMSAEAAEREDVLLGELEAAFIKADSLRSKVGEFELQKTVVWDKIDAILENRGIELNPLVKHRVLQQVLAP